MTRIFLSYSHDDADFAHRLAAALEDRGFEVWIDQQGIHGGARWSTSVQEGLDGCDALVLVVSPAAMASSNVEDEWQYALDQGKPVLPVLHAPTEVHFQLGRIQRVDFVDQSFETALGQLGASIHRATGDEAAAAGVSGGADLVDAPCPYRGLHAFTEADARYFFGREVFTERLVDTLAAKPMVGVIGPSGSGKSSVMHAGMLPELRGKEGKLGKGANGAKGDRRSNARNGSGGWTVLKLRPGAEPFQAMAGALVPLLETELSETARLVEVSRMAGALADGTLSVPAIVDRIRDKHEHVGAMLFVVDQFEELYTLSSELRAQRAFQDLLFDTIGHGDDAQPLKLGLTLRADFMGHALAYRPFADAVQDHNVVLGPMNRDELGRVVVKPAELQGRSFESGLVERIVNDVGDEAGALPLLEFALTKLWERQEEGVLTHEAYESIGRVEGAVARHADTVYDGLRAEDQDRSRQVFVQLVRPGEGTEDTRRVARKEELGAERWGLVRKLADARLVVTNRDEGGHETVEVVHEALIRTWGRLKEWMGEDRRFRMWQERLRFAVRQWDQAERDEGALLRGVPLAEAREWRTKRAEDLSGPEAAYLDASVALADRRTAQARERRKRDASMARRVRNLLAAVAALAVAGLAVSSWYAQESRANARQARDNAAIAERQATVSRVRELAAASLLEMDANPELGTLLALEALHQTWPRSDDVLPEVEHILHRALQSPVPEHLISATAPEGGWRLFPLPDGRSFWHVDWMSGASLWDMAPEPTRRKLATHTGVIRSLSYSPDGTRIATGAQDGLAIVWDAETGEVVHALDGHEGGGVMDATFSPDGGSLATAGRDGRVLLWDLASETVRRSFDGDDELYLSAVFSPDGATLATTGPSSAALWDVATGELVRRLEGRESTFRVLAFQPDGRRLASGGEEEAVSIWDVATGEREKQLEVPVVDVTGLAFSADGRQLVAAMKDGLRVWDVESGELLRAPQGDDGKVKNVAFSPDGRQIATLSSMTITLRSAVSWEPELELAREADQNLWDVGFHPDGRRLAVASLEGLIVWDIEAREIAFEVPVPAVWVGAAYAPDGRTMATGGHGGVRLWDAETLEPRRRFEGGGRVRHLAFDPTGTLLAGGDRSGRLLLWDVASGERLLDVEGHDGYINCLAYSPDGALIATGGGAGDPSAKVWDASTGELVYRFEAHAFYVNDIFFSPDGQTIVSAGSDNAIRAWDARTGEPQWDVQGQYVNRLSLDTDGRHLAGTMGDGAVQVYEVKTGKLTRRLCCHDRPIRDAQYLPGGQHLVTAGSGPLRSLPLGAPLESWSVQPHTDWVQAMGLSPDGRHLALASNDHEAVVLDLEQGEEVLRLKGHSDVVMAVAYSPDGQSIATAGSDKSARVWDAHTGESLLVIDGFEGTSWINDVTFSPDGSSLLTADGNKAAVVWDLESGEKRFEATHINCCGLNRAIYAPDGSTLYTQGQNSVIMAWDGQSGESIGTIDIDSGWHRGLTFNPDATVLASGSERGDITLWDMASNAVTETLLGHGDVIRDLAFSHDGRLLASASEDRTVRIWDLAAGTSTTLVADPSGVFSVAFNADATRLYIGTGDGHVHALIVPVEQLIERVEARLLRPFTDTECRQYLHLPDGCDEPREAEGVGP